MFPLLETVGGVSIGIVDKVSTFCNIEFMNTVDIKQFEESARLLRALGHPVRLAMVEALNERPWCVCELADSLGLNKSAASKHLSLLKDLGVIDMERDGTRVNCTLMMSCVLEMMHCANRNYGSNGNQAKRTFGGCKTVNDDTSSSCCSTSCCTPKDKEKL